MDHNDNEPTESRIALDRAIMRCTGTGYIN